MNESIEYVINVCDILIDDAVNDRNRKKGWFSVLELMKGVKQLKDLNSRLEGNKK